MAHDHRSERPTRRGRIDDSGGDTEGGKQALLPPHAAGRERGRLPQPDPALEPRLPRGLLLQAADGLGSARAVPRRADRHHRLSRRARAAGAAAGRREGRLRQGRPAAGDLRQGQSVRRAAGSRSAGPARHQPEAGRDRQANRRTAARHQRFALHASRGSRVARRAAVRADGRADLRPEALQVRGPGALPQDRRTRCATCSASSPRRATTRSGSPSAATLDITFGNALLPNFPIPPGFADDKAYLDHLAWEGAQATMGRRAARRRARPRRLRAQGHQRHGLRVVLPDHLGPHPLRP